MAKAFKDAPAADAETVAVVAPESRDETHDSIDHATGALTPEAVEKRRRMQEGLE